MRGLLNLRTGHLYGLNGHDFNLLIVAVDT